jgi:hypothetical protein
MSILCNTTLRYTFLYEKLGQGHALRSFSKDLVAYPSTAHSKLMRRQSRPVDSPRFSPSSIDAIHRPVDIARSHSSLEYQYSETPCPRAAERQALAKRSERGQNGANLRRLRRRPLLCCVVVVIILLLRETKQTELESKQKANTKHTQSKQKAITNTNTNTNKQKTNTKQTQSKAKANTNQTQSKHNTTQ